MLTVLPFLGIVLNGTSSVLYVTVPDLATPIAYGMIADHSNRTVGIVAAALTAAVTIPLILALRPILENKRSISAEQRRPWKSIETKHVWSDLFVKGLNEAGFT
jgi:hypothetical protein